MNSSVSTLGKISIHDASALERLARGHAVDPHQLRLLRNAFYKKSLSPDDAAGMLRAGKSSTKRVPSSASPSDICERIDWSFLELRQRHDSRLDGATKLLLETRQGFLIEAVLLRFAKGRTGLCISSQAGCAAACTFCATGKMGTARDLSASEMLDQVIVANRLLRDEGRRVRNIVFMGMGEPFHNEGPVFDALDVLFSTKCFDYSPHRVVVSTVGVADAMVRCAERFPRIHLALSLHSAREEVRRRIVPLTKVWGLASLRDAMEEVVRLQGQRIFIEYILLEGVNDTGADIEALDAYLQGLPVHINLIPFNDISLDGDVPSDEERLRGTRRDRRESFGAALRERGWPVTLRYSLGADIDAACGQLVRSENRAIDAARRTRERAGESQERAASRDGAGRA